MNYNIFDYESIRYNPTAIKVGDRIKMNGYEYMVREITYECGTGSLPIMKFECEQLCHWPPLISEPYIPYMNHIRFETMMPDKLPIQEEEISEETRKEFMKLLE